MNTNEFVSKQGRMNMSLWIVALLVYTGITLWVFVSNADNTVYNMMKLLDNLSNISHNNLIGFGAIAMLVYKLSAGIFATTFCVLVAFLHAMFWWTPFLQSISKKANYANS